MAPFIEYSLLWMRAGATSLCGFRGSNCVFLAEMRGIVHTSANPSFPVYELAFAGVWNWGYAFHGRFNEV